VGLFAAEETMLDSFRDMDGDESAPLAPPPPTLPLPLLASPPPPPFASFCFAAANVASLHADVFILPLSSFTSGLLFGGRLGRERRPQ
jgi:hypothetical protein